MNRFWMAGAKALAATTALVCGAMVASTAARADYSYTFTFSPLNPLSQISSASGSFSTSVMVDGVSAAIVNSGNYSIVNNGTTYTGAIQFGRASSILQLVGAYQSGMGRTFGMTGYFSVLPNGNISSNATAYSDTANNSVSIAGLFSATFISGPSGGGGGSGGAPTPEVNAGLGVLIAGATFVFLRRKRGTRHEAAAA